MTQIGIRAAVKHRRCARAAVRLAHDPEARERMLRSQQALVNPRAAEDILDDTLRREG